MYNPGEYVVNGMEVSCNYNKNELDGGQWDQTGEKMMKTSLMFSDLESYTNNKIKFDNGFGWQHMWGNADPPTNRVSLPWQLKSGIKASKI